MSFPVHEFDPALAFNALISFAAAYLVMTFPICYVYQLVTKRTWFWFHRASLLVILIFVFWSRESTMGTSHYSMLLFLVLLSLSLRHAHTALFTPVVLSQATDFVHPELGDGNHLLTHGAHLGFLFLLSHVHIYQFLIYQNLFNNTQIKFKIHI